MKPHIHLAFDLSWTHLEGRWRIPGAWVGRTYPDLSIYKELASIAERGLIDMLFLATALGSRIRGVGRHAEAIRWGVGFPGAI